jgi:hypothetical protein
LPGQRVARKAEATWHALRDAARRSTLAHMDETGWKVGARLRWLWAVLTGQATFCEILPGRGFAEAAAILEAEYAGWLIHDGWGGGSDTVGGADIMEVKELLSHRNATTTQIYDKRRRAAREGASYKMPL